MDYYTIGVAFKGYSKSYTYKVPANTKVTSGGFVVVNTMTGLQIVTVKEVHDDLQDTVPGVDYKYIAYLLDPVITPECKVSRL